MKKRIPLIICIIEILVTGVFLFELIRLKVFPTRYLVITGIIGILISSALIYITKYKIGRRISIGLSILLIAGLIYSTYYAVISRHLIEKVTKTDEKIENALAEDISVIVLADRNYSSIADISNKFVGYDVSINRHKMEYTSSFIKTNYKVEYNDVFCENAEVLVNSLYCQKIDAIIIESSKYEMLNEVKAGFTDNTKELEVVKMDYSTIPSPTPTPTPIHTPSPKVTPKPTAPAEEEPEKEPVIDPEALPYYNDSVKELSFPEDNTPLTDRPFALYISGIDTRGPVATVSRSDTNLILFINPKLGKMLIVSTPRDTYVPLHGVSHGIYDKFTHSGLYGINCSLQTLQDIYGVRIDRYFRINFSSVIQIVNALGGVDVYNAKGFNSFHMPGHYFEQGMVHMNGAEALAFCRERYAFGDGDFQRGRNHIEMIKAIIDKVTSPSVLINYAQLISSLSSSFQTNMSYDEMTSLIRKQMDEDIDWQYESLSLNNFGRFSRSCYSLSGPRLYVGYIDENSRTNISNRIKDFMK